MRLPMLAAITALSLAAVAVLATVPGARAADVEANKKIVRTLIDEVMNKRQLDAVDRFLAPDFIEHNPNLPQGREGRKQFAAAVHAGFSDYRGEIVEILAEGDKVVVRTQWSRHAGRPVPRPAALGQQGALLDRRFLPHRQRQGRRALGRGRQPAARRGAGPGAAAQDADRDRAAQVTVGASRGTDFRSSVRPHRVRLLLG